MRNFFLITFLLVAFSANCQDDWKLVKNKDQIQVYTKKIEGSPFVILKIKTLFKCSIEDMLGLLQDISNQVDYIEGCLSSKVVGKDEDGNQMYYQLSHMPWPFKNRDGVYSQRLVVNDDGDKYTLKIRLVDDVVPETEDNVRMQVVNASWEFLVKSDQQIYGEYNIKFDPAGSIPAWIVNAFVDIAPYRSIIKMKKILEPED